MKFYAFTCPACAHTFRRILSQVVDTVACPLCGGAARHDDDESAVTAPQEPEPWSADRRTVSRVGPPSNIAPACADSDDDDGEAP